ncbi:MAG: aminoacetone oxidase family FAD-binding enzyme [Planctomycetes bacterium]|nr:aminoacetone oxidase family FAD-binding enzyme [Planctomycetota bacterium]
MNDPINIAIVGGGAAGLATAIFAAQSGAKNIVILDGAKKLGAKILVSGGGRCNVTHEIVTPADYHGPQPVVRNVLRAFDEHAAVEWFASLGVTLKREDTGKLFPTTDDAHTVLDALTRRCDELGVTMMCDTRVTDVRKADTFELETARGGMRASRLVMATGGKSLPKTGSNGLGWLIVQRLGHTVTPTYPALVPLMLADGFFHAELSGIAHEVELSVYAGGKRIEKRRGSLLWTHFGVSGPVVMDASRAWVIANAEGAGAEVRCSFAAGKSFEDIDAFLAARPPTSAIGSALAANLPRRVVEVLCRHVGIDPAERCGQITRERRRLLTHALTGLTLPIERDRGWNYAEVTAGGIPMSEVDHRTMQSRIVDGLQLVGEILDVEGRIGGFNFQWAWATGHAAGCHLAKSSAFPV